MSTTTTQPEIDSTTQAKIYEKIAQNLGVQTKQITAFVKLYDEGATVPFIARYRKEQTGGLDDAQLRVLEKSLNYERDMATRRAKILDLLTAQGNLDEALQARIEAAKSKLELEDIYLPYRPRRRSLSSKAKAAGLEPIAKAVLETQVAPLDALANYSLPENITDDTGEVVEVDFADTQKQLAGVQAIIIDQWTQDLALLDDVRNGFGKTATLNSVVASDEKREVGEKFKDYFEHSENLARLPNHRLLAMLRGRQENVLTLKVDGEDAPFIDKIVNNFELAGLQPAERENFLVEAATSLWSDKWRPHIEHRLLTEKRLTAEADAIDVFANNLQHLLMAAPAGRKVILGVDPGIRHGVKMAVVGAEGHVLQSEAGEPVISTVYPFDGGQGKVEEAKATIAELITTYNVALVAIGNGTASRETDALIKQIISDENLTATAVVVNESGASVYSASELASDELAELDVSIRGAVSIARRLQDPLSELVKVDPKAIGVGQYQHDVNQTQLADSLDKVTQDCVNAVGVDVNTASPAILAHIAGLNRNVAQQIVNYRKDNGAFANREDLKAVPRLGTKTFEQAAGFLRIRDGQEPLDATGVHPESYELVHEILAKSDKSLADVLGNNGELQTLDTTGIETDGMGVASIIAELAKPAHDPRPEFKTANFSDAVNSISDLEVGMQLEGVVTNVTGFGCFVDVGVHQDGLVHISEMADNFIQDPLNLVKPGDIVKVTVTAVDEDRKRIGFSMKTQEGGSKSKPNAEKPRRNNAGGKKQNNRSDRTNNRSNNANKQNRNSKGKEANANKLGSFGALLKEAGLKK
ncbi:Tex family protein [Psychrobacter sp. HD31]|uniref:Tex family protein n=1 Tax=Psychrobacter sp. HD31 TaxID=3112003 RepID=UPI003DA48026